MALACFLTYRLVRDMVHSFVAFVSVLTFEGNHAPSGAGRARTFMRPTSYVEVIEKEKLSRWDTRKPVCILAEITKRKTQGDAGGYAAIGISSTSRSMSGYQRLKIVPSSPSSVRTRVCNNKCALF